jgi:hypothetical protein
MPVRIYIQDHILTTSQAKQLIIAVAENHVTGVGDLMRNADAERFKQFRTTKTLLDQYRATYIQDSVFIGPASIGAFEPVQLELVRKANLATFISSILDAHGVPFSRLNQYFLEVFVPLGRRLLKWQGILLLELKTQAYISALIKCVFPPDSLLDDLFPYDLDVQILKRHPDASGLSLSEQDFVARCKARRSYLDDESTPPDAFDQLSRRYQWAGFVHELISSVRKNLYGMIGNKAGARGQVRTNKSATCVRVGPLTTDNGSMILSDPTDSASLLIDTHKTRQTSNQELELGEAVASSVLGSRVRKAWTKSEEDALLAGLSCLRGPYWSRILALHDMGGSIDDALKDRNQVQLKDKARNLKLGYLKAGKELPECLQGVTGMLENRGGVRVKAALAAARVAEAENTASRFIGSLNHGNALLNQLAFGMTTNPRET